MGKLHSLSDVERPATSITAVLVVGDAGWMVDLLLLVVRREAAPSSKSEVTPMPRTPPSFDRGDLISTRGVAVANLGDEASFVFEGSDSLFCSEFKDRTLLEVWSKLVWLLV